MSRFKITKLLGEGGMGKVYLALSQGKPFALKFLDPRVAKTSLGFFRA